MQIIVSEYGMQSTEKSGGFAIPLIRFALRLGCLRARGVQHLVGGLRMNAGLMVMCVGSLLPVGLAQTWASVDKGYWYARSTKFLGLPYMRTLRWLRAPGDTLFTVSALVLVAFVFAGHSGNWRSEAPIPDALRVPFAD